jgi:hypothetical protein
MKWNWFFIVIADLVVLGVVITVLGAQLPRNHVASRTLRLKKSPQEIWPVLTRLAGASDVPVDVLESDPPRRLVTRVKPSEKMFGGTWSMTIEPDAGGSAVRIVEDGWVGNPLFRFASRYVIGHHATMDTLLKKVAAELREDAALSGE